MSIETRGAYTHEADPNAFGDSFYVPSVETLLIESRDVDQTYQVQVMQPRLCRGESARFPVLYLTDANLIFDMAKGISHCLQMTGQVRRFILVGIGYPGDNPFAGNLLRCRDFTSRYRAETPGLPERSAIDGVAAIQKGKKRWHGASDFLAFIRTELVPLIDRVYPTVVGDRAYFGHSLGGGLGLHAMFSHRNLFKRYIISSPSVCYDGDDFGIREAREFVASRSRLDAKVVMSVGEREEFDAHLEKLEFVSGFYRLAALLHRSRIPGLRFTSRVIGGETHSSVVPIAFSHGVQAIYGPEEQAKLVV